MNPSNNGIDREVLLHGLELLRAALDARIEELKTATKKPVARAPRSGSKRTASATRLRWQEAKKLAALLGEKPPRHLGMLDGLRRRMQARKSKPGRRKAA